LVKSGGGRGEALEHWKAATADPAAAHNNLAVALMEEGRYGEARQELDAALALKRNYLPAMRNLAILAERDGNPAVLPAGGMKAKSTDRRGGIRKFWDLLIGASPAPQQAQTNLGVRSE
jgi:tetratricopeptide (TPR) repeat protein